MKSYQCVCGKIFDSPQKFNGHKSNCKIHKQNKGTYEARIQQRAEIAQKVGQQQKEKNALRKSDLLNQWISEKHECERCGIIMTEKFGSGRFCSRKCANSRDFSESAREKKSIASKGRIAYSNGEEVRYFKAGDIIPEGFIEGNFNAVKHFETFEAYTDAVKLRQVCGHTNLYQNPNKPTHPRNTEHKIRYSRDRAIAVCKDFIEEHNKSILVEYEKLLEAKAAGKTFKVDNTFLYAKYLSITDPFHPRQNEGHVFVHVILAETLLDRGLEPNEIVHHKDSNKLHNSFDNIYIFNDKASHGRFHHASLYWLRIDNDVLICDKVSNDLLKEFYDKINI